MQNLNYNEYQEEIKIDTLQQQSLNTIRDVDRATMNKDLIDSWEQRSKKNLMLNMNDSHQNIISQNHQNIIHFIDFTSNFQNPNSNQDILISKIPQGNQGLIDQIQIQQTQNVFNNFTEQMFIDEYMKNYAAILNQGGLQDVNIENEKLNKLESMNIELQQKIREQKNNYNLKHLKMLNKFNLNQRELNYKLKKLNKPRQVKDIDQETRNYQYFQTQLAMQNTNSNQAQEAVLPNMFDNLKNEVARPISQKIGRINKNNLMNTFSQNLQSSNNQQQQNQYLQTSIQNQDNNLNNVESTQNKEFSSIFNKKGLLDNDEVISKTIHSNQSHYNNYDLNFKINQYQNMNFITRNSYQNAQSLIQKTNKLKHLRKKVLQNEQMFIIQNEESKKPNDDDPTTNDFSSDLNILTPITNNLLVNKHFVVTHSKTNKLRVQNQKVSPNSQMSQNEKNSTMPPQLFNMSNMNLRKGITTADTNKRFKISMNQKQKLNFLKSQGELKDNQMNTMSQGHDSLISQKAMRLNIKNKNQPQQIINLIVDKNQIQNIHQSDYQLQQTIDLKLRNQKEMDKKKEYINKMIENMKIQNIELDAKKGLSIFHQNTFTNLFEMEAKNPWFQDNFSSQISPQQSQFNQFSTQIQIVSDQDFSNKGLKIKDNIIQMGERQLLDESKIQRSVSHEKINQQKLNIEFQKSKDQPAIQNPDQIINSPISSNQNMILEMDYQPISLLTQKSKSYSSTQYFKREINNSIHKSRALYQNENQQLKQIYEHINKKKDQNVKIKKNNIPHNQTYEANNLATFEQNIHINDLILRQGFSDDESSKHLFQNFQKTEKVQTQIIELDDILSNRQFQKGDFNQQNIQKQFKILKKQQQGIFSQRTSEVKQSSLFQENKSFSYNFKHNELRNPKNIKEKMVQFSNKSQNPIKQKQQQSNQNIFQLLQKQKHLKKSKKNIQKKQISQNSSSSQTSQNNHNNKNDHLYNCEKYLIILNEEIKQDYENQEENKIKMIQKPNLEINENRDIHDLISKIDKYILIQKNFPQDLTQLSSFTIKKMAMELYQIIYEIEDVPISDKRYNRFIINVFRLFSSDPLKNTKVNCAVKTCTSNFNDFEPYKKLNKKEMQSCSHTFEDENDTKQRYLLQYWFLNFCKYIYIMLLNSELQQQMSDNLFYEDNKDLVDKKSLKVSQIKDKSNELVHQMIQKQSRKKQAVDSILKNLSSSMNQMTKEERIILKDACTVINLMNNPLIKLIVVEKPQLFINYKVDVEIENNLNKIFEIQSKKVLLINELAQKIIHNYRNEILTIKKKKYITFKNYQKGYQEFKLIFDEEDEKSILRNLEMKIQEQNITQNQRQGILTEDVTSRSKNTVLQLKEDDSFTNQKSTDQIQIKELSSMHQKSYIQQIASSASDRQTSAHNIEISNQENPLYLTQIDALKHVLNILNEKKNVEIIGKYENQIAKNPDKSDQMQIYHEQRKKLKKQMSQFDSSYNISSETKEMFHQELNKKIPIELQINLYKQLKKIESYEDVKLYDKQDIQFQFFNSAKELIQGIEDKISNIQIEYFKVLRSQHILEVPLLFKFMENNLICFKGFKLNLEQAVAIKQTLIDQQVLFNNQKQKGKVEDNPFIVKSLIINDCSMTDEVFEQILIGIQSQNSIKNIHYTNNNVLGDKSAAILCEILKRNQPKNKLVELHLSNIKIKDTVRKNCPGALAQIMMQVDDTKLLSRLRISNINLRKEKLMIKYIVSIIETFGFELQYFNLQNCNIHIEDLARISAYFLTCEKLEFLDLSWNQFPNYCTQMQMNNVDQFVNNLCAFILLPTSSLRFLDISGFQFKTQHLLQILQAIQRNQILMSVNFGNLQNKENRKLIKQEFQIEDAEQGFLMKNKNDYKDIITEKIKFKDFYINAGLLKRLKKDQLIAESSLFKKPIMKQCEREAEILLQRYSFNQELLMNPGTLLGYLDTNQSQKWFIHNECYYFNRYRYSLIFFNQKEIDSNNFQILDKQKEFMLYIDLLLGGSKKEFRGPVIVVNGQIYKMLDSVIFACFLQIKAIVIEVKHLLSQKIIFQPEINNKSAESSKNNSKKQNGEKKKKNIQEHLNIALKNLDENSIKELLIKMSETTLTNKEIEKMNEDQQNIASLFEGLNWERCIDENLVEKNKQLISLINPQQTKIYRQIQANIDDLKSKSNNIELTKKTQNSEIFPHLKMLKDQLDDVKMHSPSVYVFAGYLPPGKNTIYVYDRERQKVLTKEVIVDMTSSEFGRVGGDWMLNPTFPYIPRKVLNNIIAQ